MALPHKAKYLLPPPIVPTVPRLPGEVEGDTEEVSTTVGEEEEEVDMIITGPGGHLRLHRTATVPETATAEEEGAIPAFLPLLTTPLALGVTVPPHPPQGDDFPPPQVAPLQVEVEVTAEEEEEGLDVQLHRPLATALSLRGPEEGEEEVGVAMVVDGTNIRMVVVVGEDEEEVGITRLEDQLLNQ